MSDLVKLLGFGLIWCVSNPGGMVGLRLSFLYSFDVRVGRYWIVG